MLHSMWRSGARRTACLPGMALAWRVGGVNRLDIWHSGPRRRPARKCGGRQEVHWRDGSGGTHRRAPAPRRNAPRGAPLRLSVWRLALFPISSHFGLRSSPWRAVPATATGAVQALQYATALK